MPTIRITMADRGRTIATNGTLKAIRFMKPLLGRGTICNPSREDARAAHGVAPDDTVRLSTARLLTKSNRSQALLL
jgi:hypothetical protein